MPKYYCKKENELIEGIWFCNNLCDHTEDGTTECRYFETIEWTNPRG